MASNKSTGVVTNRAVPDPRGESLAPDFDVRLARELQSLLKIQLDGPDDGAVALGARLLSTIFPERISSDLIPIEDARSSRSVAVGGFTAWPIFITYAGGHRDTYAAIHNGKQVEEALGDFITSGPSSVRGAINEAIRNIGQHGHNFPMTGYGQCALAPAALLVKEVGIDSGHGVSHRVLIAVIADEGQGICDPERSLLNGIGSGWGDAKLGMGIELKSCLLYLVKSTKGEWCLFDRAHQNNPDMYEAQGCFRERSIGDDERIPRVSTIDLPAPPQGCQKIMFFNHPTASAEAVIDIRHRLLSALSSMQR